MTPPRSLTRNWKPSSGTSWLIGVDRRDRFRARIGDLLLATEVCYSGGAYCFALGALLRLDALLGTHHADRFTEPDGLWDHSVKGVGRPGYPSHAPADLRRWTDLHYDFANGSPQL